MLNALSLSFHYKRHNHNQNKLGLCSRPIVPGCIRGHCLPNFFVLTQIFCDRKNVFETYNETKNLHPLKGILPPQTLKPGYGPAGRMSKERCTLRLRLVYFVSFLLAMQIVSREYIMRDDGDLSIDSSLSIVKNNKIIW